MTRPSPSGYPGTDPAIIRFTPSRRNVEDPLQERCVDLGREAVRFRWQRFGTMCAADIRPRRVPGTRPANRAAALAEGRGRFAAQGPAHAGKL